MRKTAEVRDDIVILSKLVDCVENVGVRVTPWCPFNEKRPSF